MALYYKSVADGMSEANSAERSGCRAVNEGEPNIYKGLLLWTIIYSTMGMGRMTVVKSKNQIRAQRYARRRPRGLALYRRVNATGSRAMPSMAPREIKLKLNWAATVSVTSAGGAFTGATKYRLNSPQHPDAAPGTNTDTALGFNDWDNLYNKYKVYGCKVEFHLQNVGTAAGSQNIKLAIAPLNSNGTFTSMEDMIAAPFSVHKLNNIQSAGTILKKYYNLHKLMGLSLADYEAEDNFGAAVTTVPSQIQWLSIGVESLDGSTATTILGNVKITYYVKFYSPKRLALA